MKAMTFDLEILHLLEQGFNPNQQPRAAQSRSVPLHRLLLACLYGNLEEVRRLSNDPSVEIEAFYPFLHAAIKGGHTEVVEFLLQEGANKNTAFNGLSPLHLAFQNNKLKIFKLLLFSGADLSRLYDEFPQIIHVAASEGQLKFLELLLRMKGGDVNCRDSNNDTPLLCVGGNLEVANFLVQKGADVNARNDYESTALHAACHFDGPDSPALVDFLIRSGAVVNAKDIFEATPLHVASAKGNISIMRSLVDGGAEVNALDMRNKSPLHYAVYEESSLDVVKFLVEAGVDLWAEQFDGLTALDIAASRRERNKPTVKYLISSLLRTKAESLKSFLAGFGMKNYSEEILHALITARDINKSSLLEISLQNNFTSLLQFGVLNGRPNIIRHFLQLGALNGTNQQIIHTAIRANNVEVLKEVLEAIWSSCGENGRNFAVEMNRREDLTGETPLMTAVRSGRLELVKVLAEEAAVDLNLKNEEGLTAIHIAVDEDLIEIAQLLAWNVDVTLRDKKGRTARDIAKEKFCQEIFQFLPQVSPPDSPTNCKFTPTNMKNLIVCE